MKNLEIETLERMYSAENVFERYSAKLMERSWNRRNKKVRDDKSTWLSLFHFALNHEWDNLVGIHEIVNREKERILIRFYSKENFNLFIIHPANSTQYQDHEYNSSCITENIWQSLVVKASHFLELYIFLRHFIPFFSRQQEPSKYIVLLPINIQVWERISENTGRAFKITGDSYLSVSGHREMEPKGNSFSHSLVLSQLLSFFLWIFFMSL